MINGSHVIIYSKQAERLRSYFRDVLGFRHVDAGGGWLIFALPPAEVAMHPTRRRTYHELFLTCSDITATMRQLKKKGAKFDGPAVDRGWGIMATIRMPDGGAIGLYEPKHPTAQKPKAPRGRASARSRATPARTTRRR